MIETTVRQKKPLFRMTRKRVIILNGVITTVKNKIESNESFLEHTVPVIPDRDNRTKLKEEYEEATKNLRLYHDVLETVISHNRDFHLKTFRFEDSDWKTEWDIPLALFVEALSALKELIVYYQSKTQNEHLKKKRQIKIDMLQTLIEFRRKHEQE